MINLPRHLVSPLPLCLALLCLAARSPAQPPNPADALRTLVTSFYTPYVSNPSGQEPPDAATVISAHATPTLLQLFKNDEACQIRSQGVCNLDFDIIVSAQDWTITAPPRVTVLQASATQITIASRFTNDTTPTEVDYIFTSTSGHWLIADMTSPTPAADSWRLTKILANEPG